MIDQVTNANKNVFAPLQSNSGIYAISKPFTPEQKAKTEQEKEKKSHHYGIKIAGGALIVGFGVLLLLKGLPKNARLKLNNLFKNLEEKTTKLTDEKQSLTGFQNFYLKSLNRLKKLTQYSQATFTFAPLKDSFFRMISKKIPIVERFSQASSRLFEKVSVGTSHKSYKKTLLSFDRMYGTFAEMKGKITDSQAIQQIDQKIARIKSKYDKAFNIEARNRRLTEMKRDMDDIDERFIDETWRHMKKFLTSEKARKTFVSEELAMPAKIKMHNKINPLKEAISVSTYDNYVSIKKLLDNIDLFVDPTDVKIIKLIKDISKNLEKYKKVSSASTELKETILKSLTDLNEHLVRSGYDKKVTKPISESIRILSSNKKGEIQELMDIYKQHLSKEDYEKLEKSVGASLTSLNKSVDMESDLLFDKIRDIQIGSAPMDVLGVISSIVAVIFGLSLSDNKDERISVALKYGIPAVGAVATSLYCTMALVSGGKSLIIGLVAGQLINILGVMADKARKKYMNQP